MKFGLGSLEPPSQGCFFAERRAVLVVVPGALRCAAHQRNTLQAGAPSQAINYTDCRIDAPALRRLKEGQRIVKHGCRHRPRIIIVLSPTP